MSITILIIGFLMSLPVYIAWLWLESRFWVAVTALGMGYIASLTGNPDYTFWDWGFIGLAWWVSNGAINQTRIKRIQFPSPKELPEPTQYDEPPQPTLLIDYKSFEENDFSWSRVLWSVAFIVLGVCIFVFIRS